MKAIEGARETKEVALPRAAAVRVGGRCSVPPRLRERHSLACRGAHEDAKTRRRSKNYGGGEFCLLNPDF